MTDSNAPFLDELRSSFGLRMDARGRLWQHEAPFEHPRICAFLRQHIEFEQGQYRCRLGQRWVPLEVEDQPLRVRHLHLQGDTPYTPFAQLDDGRNRVPFCPTQLRADKESNVRCPFPSVSGQSQLWARLESCAMLELASRLRDIESQVPLWDPGAKGAPLPLPDFWDTDETTIHRPTSTP